MAWLYVEYWLTVLDLEDVKITKDLQIETIFSRELLNENIGEFIIDFSILQRRVSWITLVFMLMSWC